MLKINRFFIFSSLLFSLTLSLEANIFHKSLDFKEGIVHYKVCGHETGIEVAYIKNYGEYKTIYRYTKSNLFLRDDINRVRYISPKWDIVIDIKNHTTTKKPNLTYILEQKILHLPLKDRLKVTKKLKKLKYSSIYNLKSEIKIDNKSIAGYSCIKEYIDGVTIYRSLNNIILKKEINILGFHSTTTVTDIEKKVLNPNIFISDKLDMIEPSPKDSEIVEKRAEEILTYLLK